jgi:hypothetical protein
MEARRSKNFKEFYKSTGEHSVNIRGHVRLTLLGLYPGWTNQVGVHMLYEGSVETSM